MQSSKKVLIVRLSSLGDVVLATSALEALAALDVKPDWVVASEFADLLLGHPKIRNLYTFDRRLGLSGWFRLSAEIGRAKYDIIYDLHSTIRSRILCAVIYVGALFHLWERPKWKKVSKNRFRLWGYFLFKRLWLKPFRPLPWTKRFSRLVGGTGDEKPDLSHLLQGTPPDEFERPELHSKPYLCLMPGSAWPGKRWPITKFFQAAMALDATPVILGTKADQESRLLEKMFQEAGRDFISGVGKWDLRTTAAVLAKSIGYLGNDTGLAHLAEAVGAPAFVIFGPTRPDMGFGPWRRESRALSARLFCSPCGKDGRFCFRLGNRYACLKSLEAQDAIRPVQERSARTEKPSATEPAGFVRSAWSESGR